MLDANRQRVITSGKTRLFMRTDTYYGESEMQMRASRAVVAWVATGETCLYGAPATLPKEASAAKAEPRKESTSVEPADVVDQFAPAFPVADGAITDTILRIMPSLLLRT